MDQNVYCIMKMLPVADIYKGRAASIFLASENKNVITIQRCKTNITYLVLLQSSSDPGSSQCQYVLWKT